ncbi:MAG: hypothetical protein EBZ50_01590 [Alphaproteobacteria bacterium]|nr:hypothetical protein [Alphaproteobacteria bacterium]
MTTPFLPVLDTRTKSEAGIEVTIRRPDNGEPVTTRGVPLVLVVKGMDSRAYSEAVAQASEARADVAAKGQKLDVDAFRARILAACTIGWKGVFDRDGNPVPFSTEIAEQMFLQLPVLAEQVDGAIGDRSRFLLALSND